MRYSKIHSREILLTIFRLLYFFFIIDRFELSLRTLPRAYNKIVVNFGTSESSFNFLYVMMIAPNSRARNSLAPRVKGVEWGSGMKGFRIVAVF